MNKYEFTLVFQYDDENVNIKNLDKKIKKSVEALGGTFESSDEYYGVVDVSCKFEGTAEQAQKIGQDLLAHYSSQNIKMSTHITQKYYAIRIQDNLLPSHLELINDIKHMVNSFPMSHVVKNENNPNEFIMMIASKEQYEQLKESVNLKVANYSNDFTSYNEIENKLLFEGNNYSIKKKTSFI